MPDGGDVPGRMRAAVLYGPEDLVIEDVEVPTPGPGEILLRVEAALTGGTTAKVFRRGYHARMGEPPLRMGHEGAGTVAAVGEGVAAWRTGQRVVPANSAACGRCRACGRGHTAQCEDMVWLNGFFAEYVRVPARIAAENTYTLPDGLAPEAASLAGALATVVKGHDRTPVRRGERALVIGTGALGLLWVRLLATSGARVTAVGRRPERNELALALGAEEAVPSSAFEPGARHTDLVVEAVGTRQAWETALAAAAPGSRVHLFGGPPRGMSVPLDSQRLHYDELLVTASFHHTPFHFAEALRLLAEGFVDPVLLVQERIGLDDVPAHMATAASGGGPLKAAIVPREPD